MTREQILDRFPNASEAFIRQNITVQYEHHDAYRLASSPQRESSARDESMAETENAGSHPMRRRLLVESFRFRLIDADNLFAKYLIDALVKAGILYDDSEAFCEIEVKQIKVDTKWMERTEITITQL